jgi:hypothetical protein
MKSALPYECDACRKEVAVVHSFGASFAHAEGAACCECFNCGEPCKPEESDAETEVDQ